MFDAETNFLIFKYQKSPGRYWCPKKAPRAGVPHAAFFFAKIQGLQNLCSNGLDHGRAHSIAQLMIGPILTWTSLPKHSIKKGSLEGGEVFKQLQPFCIFGLGIEKKHVEFNTSQRCPSDYVRLKRYILLESPSCEHTPDGWRTVVSLTSASYDWLVVANHLKFETC